MDLHNKISVGVHEREIPKQLVDRALVVLERRGWTSDGVDVLIEAIERGIPLLEQENAGA